MRARRPYGPVMSATTQPIGLLLRQWRRRRGLSQLHLAANAEVSQRHLSFVESGRSAPSRDMVLHLADELGVPLRERNVLLVAAGFAPIYSDRRLDDPALGPVRDAVDVILAGHEPYPALAVDRHWTLVASNRAVGRLLLGVDAELLRPPVNVLRVSLHPRGVAPRIANLRAWRDHVIARLTRQIDNSADLVLARLKDELSSYPVPGGATARAHGGTERFGHVAVPLDIATPNGVLSLLSTTTVFGAPLDAGVADLAVESFFPMNSATATLLRAMADTARCEAANAPPSPTPRPTPSSPATP